MNEMVIPSVDPYDVAKIRQALAKYGTAKEDAWFIGDTTGDIREAKAVGIKTIAVTWGWHSREKLAAVEPDYLIDRPEELLVLSCQGLPG